MTRKRVMLAALLSLALPPAALWATVDLDLKDFDEDVMRDVDDTVKSLDSDIATHNSASAIAEAQTIQQALKYAEDYFVKKGNVDDAVKWARQGEDQAQAVRSSVAASDFDAASDRYEALMKTCRACHDVYRPPDL
jgi:hypothetical protein